LKKYKHLFFDLDHTLWDFAVNEKNTLQQLYEKHNLNRFFSTFDNFFEVYLPVNLGLWNDYRNGIITKEIVKINRFYDTFRSVGYEDEKFAQQFANEFVVLSPMQTKLIPNTLEVLDYLFLKYNMHIITNGFCEVQYVKLEKSGLRPYFKHIFISEEIGYQKPDVEFFDYAIKTSNATKNESLVIGDNLEVDILGSKNSGIDHVYYNPDKIPHEELIFKEISSLLELKTFL